MALKLYHFVNQIISNHLKTVLAHVDVYFSLKHKLNHFLLLLAILLPFLRLYFSILYQIFEFLNFDILRLYDF